MEVLKGIITLERKWRQWVSKTLKSDHRQKADNNTQISWSSSDIKCIECLKLIKNRFQTSVRPKYIKVTLFSDQKAYVVPNDSYLISYQQKTIGTLRITYMTAC